MNKQSDDKASFESKNYNLQVSDTDHVTAIVDQSYYLSDNINKARCKIRNNNEIQSLVTAQSIQRQH